MRALQRTRIESLLHSLEEIHRYKLELSKLESYQAHTNITTIYDSNQNVPEIHISVNITVHGNFTDYEVLRLIRRYFKMFPHFIVCRVLVSVRLLRVGSIVHHILIV